jgi:RNA polymerase sigma factor (sigma-70 family)
MSPDSELLGQFARTNSQEAFAELVKRHVNLVYSAALRQVNGDEYLSKDVAQIVFTDLARKAGSLSRRTNLTGWLYTSAHFAAAKIVRGENRRRDREEKFMREPTNDSGAGFQPAEFAPGADWEKLRPTLDDAMHELKEADRDAILLRYFENQPFIQVGAKLGLNENAARMRVERALEKLRDIFTKRGITTATALASVISANAIQMAPANLAVTLTTASIATAGTGTFTLLKIMTATKLKLAFSALVVAGATTAFVIQHQAQEKLRADNETLRQQVSQLQANNESLSNHLADAGDSQKLSDQQLNELLKLRGEVGVLRRHVDESEKTREEINEANQKAQLAKDELAAILSANVQFESHQTAIVNAAKILGLYMRQYAGDHENQFPTNSLYQLADDYGDTNLLQNIPSLEFINVGLTKLNSQNQPDYPNMVLVRERLARQAPDGTWSRIYGFADGSVQIATSNDGNFDAWEKANTYSPPPNQ